VSLLHQEVDPAERNPVLLVRQRDLQQVFRLRHLREAEVDRVDDLNRARLTPRRVRLLRRLSKVRQHQPSAAGRHGEDLRQVQLLASLVVRRLNPSKVDIKAGDLSKRELLLLRARLHTRAVAEDARLSKPERRLRLA
jgi:hypothetical protein